MNHEQSQTLGLLTILAHNGRLELLKDQSPIDRSSSPGSAIFEHCANLAKYYMSMGHSFQIKQTTKHVYVMPINPEYTGQYKLAYKAKKGALRQIGQIIMMFTKNAETAKPANNAKPATNAKPRLAKSDQTQAITMQAIRIFLNGKFKAIAEQIDGIRLEQTKAIEQLTNETATIAQNTGQVAGSLDALRKANAKTADVLNKLSNAGMNKPQPKPETAKPAKATSQETKPANNQPKHLKNNAFNPETHFHATPTGGDDIVDFLNAMNEKYGDSVFSDFNTFNENARILWGWIKDHEQNAKGKSAYVVAPKFLGEMITYAWNIVCEQTGNTAERISQDKADKPVKRQTKPNNKAGQTEPVNAIESNSLSGWAKTLGIDQAILDDIAETCIIVNTTPGDELDRQDKIDFCKSIRDNATKAKGKAGIENIKKCMAWIFSLDNIELI